MRMLSSVHDSSFLQHVSCLIRSFRNCELTVHYNICCTVQKTFPVKRAIKYLLFIFKCPKKGQKPPALSISNLSVFDLATAYFSSPADTLTPTSCREINKPKSWSQPNRLFFKQILTFPHATTQTHLRWLYFRFFIHVHPKWLKSTFLKYYI